MINKEGKLFGKISIIDILVVILVVFAAFGVYLRFFSGNEKVETASSSIEYTIKVSEVRKGTVDALKNFGGPVYDATTKEYIGEIVDVNYTDAVKAGMLLSGQMKESVIPERYDAKVKIRVQGKVNDSGYYTSTNQAIATGGSVVFYSKAAKTSGVIEDVYEVE